MAPRHPHKPKLTDAEREERAKAEYQRFLEVAREVGASDDPADFDRAFEKVARPPHPKR